MTTSTENKIITIPNLLSMARILLIPIIVYLYVFKHQYTAAGIFILLSGATDIVDGWIARTFHMISNLGKALDPIADKLTQVTVMGCLVTRFPLMIIPLLLMVIKETCMTFTGAAVIHKTGIVPAAVWHGKVATAVLYAMMMVHVFWQEIPSILSITLILLSAALILLSFILYMQNNLHLIHNADKTHMQNTKKE